MDYLVNMENRGNGFSECSSFRLGQHGMDKSAQCVLCLRLILSWLLVGVAIIPGLVKGGIIASLFMLVLAAWLRGQHDRDLKRMIWNNRRNVKVIAVYYLLLFLSTVVLISRVDNIYSSLLWKYFILILLFPMLLIMVARDIRLCAKGKPRQGFESEP